MYWGGKSGLQLCLMCELRMEAYVFGLPAWDGLRFGPVPRLQRSAELQGLCRCRVW